MSTRELENCFSQVNTTGGSSHPGFDLTRFRSNTIPVNDKSRKKILNTKCWFQVICFSTPPQEQGRFGVNMIIYARYKVKMVMATKEPQSPRRRERGKNNNEAIRPSVMGNAKATTAAFPPMRGDLLRTFLKEVKSSSLLRAV